MKKILHETIQRNCIFWCYCAAVCCKVILLFIFIIFFNLVVLLLTLSIATSFE